MKKRLIALLLSLIMLLTCMGAALDAVVDTADTAADAAAQTDTAATAEPTGEDTTDAEPTDEETDASVEPTEDPDAEPSAEPEQPTDAAKEETPAEEAPVEDDDAIVDGEETDAEPVEDEEDADTDEDTDAEPVYPLVSFTNVAPFLDPVTGSGSSSIWDKAKDFIGGIVDAIKGGSATPADNTEDTSGDTGSGESSGLNVSKTAAYNSDTGKYTITLEAYATGEKTTTVVTKSTPTDIILVLDLSSSMKESMGYVKLEGKTNAERKALADEGKLYYCVDNKYYKVSVDKKSGTYTYSTNSGQGGGHSGGKSTQIQDPESAEFYTPQTRLEALKAACTAFAKSVADKCTSDDGTTVNHRIAVVGYNSISKLYTGGSDADAFLDMSNADNLTSIKTTIEKLSTSQGTKTDSGLEKANAIFKANPLVDGETRNRVVVLFTDGYPSTSGSDSFDTDIAVGAIKNANTLKNKYGATVYSVAVLAGANPTQKVTKDDWGGSDNGKNVNLFLHNVSSNVPANTNENFDGTPVTPTIPTDSGYYLTAGSSEDLTKIFNAISENIDSPKVSTTLNASSVVKDVISPQFTLPSGATANDITIKTYKYNGESYDAGSAWTENSGDAMGATASISDGQVSVTGFDFSANWCGIEKDATGTETAHGNKLEISFDVVPKDDFLGGNDVLTNGTAGVYENSSAEKPTVEFVSPKVNVPIKTVSVTAEEKNVYLLGSVTGSDLKNSATVKVGDVKLDLSKANDTTNPYGLEPWQTEYVNISVSVKDESDNEITNLSNLADDKQYTVSVTVTPKTETPESIIGKTATAQTGQGEANINVFKPVLTFKDSSAYYGESLPDNNDFSGSKNGDVTWKHANNTSKDNGVTMLGIKPELSISYTPDNSKISTDNKYTKQDVPVNVTVKIGEKDVTDCTSFNHTNCTGKTCTLPDGAKFLIHVNTCTLTIKKAGGVEGESYVFTVKKDGVTYTEVAIEYNDGKWEETICELPVGNYTIVEDTGWSWRYKSSGGTTKVSYSSDNGVTLSASSPSSTITCTNSNPFEYWLNGFSTIVRNIIKAVTT